MNDEVLEVKNTYYEYVTNITHALQQVAVNFRQGNYAVAFQQIIDFSEGLEWLIRVEQLLQEQYTINSRIEEARGFLEGINEALQMKDYTTVADLIEYEIAPIFNSASEWQFFEK